jgi:glycosyltransferase involved in cell wall biosynthesis
MTMKPRLLYLSPITPLHTGSGLAMRAFHNLAALSGAYDITLLIIPTGFRSAKPAAEVRALCESIHVMAVGPGNDLSLFLRLVLFKLLGASALGRRRPFEFRSCSRRRLGEAAERVAGKTFAVIHVFRLYLGPYAFRLLRDNPAARVQLDLDDFESRVRRDQSERLRLERRRKRGIRLLLEATAYERLERRWLGRFDRVFVCSDMDRQRLGEAYGDLPIAVLPNVCVPPAPEARRKTGAPFVFLFVGSFSYFPNADGLEYLCGRVLPQMGKRKKNEFVIRVVGGGVDWRTRLRFLFDRRIRFLGRVSRIDRFYDGADAALAPLRTGGGTRIKIIEAIAHRLPVVSTSKGIEGLRLEPGVDALVGDTSEEFAGHCRALMARDSLCDRLRLNAFVAFKKYYTPEILGPILAGPPAAAHAESDPAPAARIEP